MAKYKVGDQVRVKDADTCYRTENNIGFIDTMEKRCGTVVTISKIITGYEGFPFPNGVYFIEEENPPDQIRYYWAEEWLEPLGGEK
jgi:hypothetical protein